MNKHYVVDGSPIFVWLVVDAQADMIVSYHLTEQLAKEAAAKLNGE